MAVQFLDPWSSCIECIVLQCQGYVANGYPRQTLQPDLQICSQKTGQVQKSQYNVAPLQTIAVHVSKDSKILAGAKEIGPPIYWCESVVRKIACVYPLNHPILS
jgi:hypothetical protein